MRKPHLLRQDGAVSDQEYEYTAVRVVGLAVDEAKYTARINAVAEHGWRLVTVSSGKDFRDMLIFERPVQR